MADKFDPSVVHGRLNAEVDRDMEALGFHLAESGVRESRRLKGRWHVYRKYSSVFSGQSVTLCVAADDAHPQVTYREQIHQFKATLEDQRRAREEGRRFVDPKARWTRPRRP